MNQILLWWYAELERRLLVLRSHLSEGVYLFETPLAIHFYVELVLCMIHLPPMKSSLPIELQLNTFLRLYQVLKVNISTSYRSPGNSGLFVLYYHF